MKEKPRKPVVEESPVVPVLVKAVIDIGATSLRMVIAEIGKDGSVRTLESLQQSVSIGRDTFSTGKVSAETIEECVRVLRNFREVLKEYRIEHPDQVRAVATSAVQEASNRDMFLDRVFMATGINLEAIDSAEVSRLTYFSILPLLEHEEKLRQGNLLVVEVGGGHTEVLGLRDGVVSFAHSYRLGSFRIREMLEDVQVSAVRFREMLEGGIISGIRPIVEIFSAPKDVRILILGGDARFAANQIKPGWDKHPVAALRTAALSHLTDDVLECSVEELVRKFNLPFPVAESLGPALLMILNIVQQMKHKSFYTGTATMRVGLLREVSAGGAWDESFVRQIMHSAIETGLHFDFDQAHAEMVTAHARKLFHALQEEHQLSPRYETILAVAALLHDIGEFISNRSHHKHSLYLIEHSDIFGLGQQDLAMVALVARYHRRATPRTTHLEYNRLNRADRMRVSKLAAILRVADALDRGHVQRISQIKLGVLPDQLIVGVNNPRACAVERMALTEKSDMFEQVYGKKVVLRPTTQRKG
ncbi:MAG: HD domain-containing protein [Kiritimatiellales bacterium]|nr:HD domain-containing protein [Kiritimatiellales bacterium]